VTRLQDELSIEKDSQRKAFLEEQIQREKDRQFYYEMQSNAVFNRPKDYKPPTRVEFEKPEPTKHTAHPLGKRQILQKQFDNTDFPKAPSQRIDKKPIVTKFFK
jgi:hypothetical protein